MTLPINPTPTQLCRRRTATKRREKILKKGGWNLSVLLMPDAAKRLRELMSLYQANALEIISNLILGSNSEK